MSAKNLGIFVLILVMPHLAELQGQTDWLVMTSDEAGGLLKENIASIRPPLLSRWVVPEMTPEACGVRLGGSEIVLFAPSRPAQILFRSYASVEPFIPTDDPRWRLPDNKLVTSSDTKGEKSFMSLPTGVFYTDVALHVASPVILLGSPSTQVSVIPKGGYSWEISPLGVYLMRGTFGRFLLFDSPITDLWPQLWEATKKAKELGVPVLATAGGVELVAPFYRGGCAVGDNYIELTVNGKTFRFRPAEP